jgi:hypothetical protein
LFDKSKFWRLYLNYPGLFPFVIPAQAGIQKVNYVLRVLDPACAGMTHKNWPMNLTKIW